ncbi:hypothetical protein [Fusobacterium sp.]|uniref:hypothetical protein n=1 Tax=Fusobacterium sp. TaxID=68766 RepID=UPI002637E29F|nr:hypothetical protein [Fusobacterium sp.]
MKILKSFFENFRVLFIYIFIFFILSIFLKINDFSLDNFSKIIFPYFGIFAYVLLIDIFSDIYFSLKKDKILQMTYRIRLIFFNIFLLALSFFILISYVNVFLEFNSFNILFTSLNFFHFGYMFTETALYLCENFSYIILNSLTILILIISLFFSIISIIITTVRNSKKNSNKIKSLEEKKITLQNKIAIKEALIKDEQREFKNYEKAQDIAIREQLQRARNKNFRRQVKR